MDTGAEHLDHGEASPLSRTGVRAPAFFGLRIRQHVPGIMHDGLDPRQAWADGAAYDTAAAALVVRFEANFATFADLVGDDVRRGAIHAT